MQFICSLFGYQPTKPKQPDPQEEAKRRLQTQEYAAQLIYYEKQNLVFGAMEEYTKLSADANATPTDTAAVLRAIEANKRALDLVKDADSAFKVYNAAKLATVRNDALDRLPFDTVTREQIRSDLQLV